MNDKVKALLEMISKDEKLQEEFKTLKEKEDVIARAKELGFELTEEDLTPPEGEMNESELGDVTGGTDEEIDDVGFCTCPVVGGGGGSSDNEGDTWGCACVGYGQGGDAKDDHAMCICVLGGFGEGCFS